MQPAVGNLVSNAVAHTPSGGSVVMATSSESAVVRIEVADTGIGISPEALPRVFDRFFRVDPSRSQASGGTGLGLAIVQGIVLLHGGKVEIFSQPGKGTRVVLSMPAFAPAPHTCDAEPEMQDSVISHVQHDAGRRRRVFLNSRQLTAPSTARQPPPPWTPWSLLSCGGV